MRINVVGRSVVSTRNQNAKNYSTNPLNQIKSYGQDTVSFGHYLDDELESKQNELESIKSEISLVREKIEEQKEENAREKAKFDKIIAQKKSENNQLVQEIDKLKVVESEKTEKINTLNNEGKNVEGKIEDTKETIKGLQAEKETIIGTMVKNENIANEKLRDALSQSRQELYEVHKENLDKALNGPKSTLMQDVIKPIMQEKQGESIPVPSGVMIKSQSDDYAKKIFEWIVKLTDSNFAMINAAKIQDNPKLLLKMLNKIAEKSEKDFTINQRRTFTYIENFENCSMPNLQNERAIGILKDFLDNCSQDSHNTVVVSTTDFTKIDPIVAGAHRFPVKVHLDEEFFKDTPLCFASVLQDITEAKSNGKKISYSSIAYIFNQIFNPKIISSVLGYNQKGSYIKQEIPNTESSQKESISKRVEEAINAKIKADIDYNQAKNFYASQPERLAKAIETQDQIKIVLEALEHELSTVGGEFAEKLIKRLHNI